MLRCSFLINVLKVQESLLYLISDYTPLVIYFILSGNVTQSFTFFTDQLIVQPLDQDLVREREEVTELYESIRKQVGR